MLFERFNQRVLLGTFGKLFLHQAPLVRRQHISVSEFKGVHPSLKLDVLSVRVVAGR